MSPADGTGPPLAIPSLLSVQLSTPHPCPGPMHGGERFLVFLCGSMEWQRSTLCQHPLFFGSHSLGVQFCERHRCKEESPPLHARDSACNLWEGKENKREVDVARARVRTKTSTGA